MMMKRSERASVLRLLCSVAVILLLILFDQWTKQQAVLHLAGKEPFVLIPGVLEFTYVKNFGAAFGILQGKQWLFFVIAAIVCAGLFYLIIKMPAGKKYLPLHLAFLFVIAGALGNLIDRAVHTYVTDFVYFVPINFPVFNVADIYITCACAVLIVLILFVYKDDDLSFIRL